MKFKLLDTGYVSNIISGSTQLSATNRAGYTGSTVAAFQIDVQNTSLRCEAKSENKPIIKTYTDVDTTLTSVSNRYLWINCILLKSIVTSGYNFNNVVQLLKFERTQGLKLLYPSSLTDTIPTFVQAYGATNVAGVFSSGSPSEPNGTVSLTTPYLVGRVKSFTFDDNETGNYWRYSFMFEISG